MYVLFLITLFLESQQILCRCIPEDPDEPIATHVDHFFRVNHPDHYLLSQVNSHNLNSYMFVQKFSPSLFSLCSMRSKAWVLGAT